MSTESISSLPNTRPTDASCEINEANGRRVISPDDSFRCSCHCRVLITTRISYLRNYPIAYLSAPRRFRTSFVRPLLPYANATCTQPHAPHARTYGSLSLTSSFMRGFATRIHARTHARRTQHSFDKYV